VFANFCESTHEESRLGNLGGPIYTHVVFPRDANGVPTGGYKQAVVVRNKERLDRIEISLESFDENDRAICHNRLVTTFNHLVRHTLNVDFDKSDMILPHVVNSDRLIFSNFPSIYMSEVSENLATSSSYEPKLLLLE
jgi:hypothetical protein